MGSTPTSMPWTSSGSRPSSSPVARARSQVWISTSPVQMVSTVAANDERPIRVSRSLPATSGSSSAAWMARSRATHAPTGSSSTDGPGDHSMSQVGKKKAGSHSTRWRTTSRATHPSHGAGASHRSAGTARTRSVKAAATFRYRSAGSLMLLETLRRRGTHRRARMLPCSTTSGSRSPTSPVRPPSTTRCWPRSVPGACSTSARPSASASTSPTSGSAPRRARACRGRPTWPSPPPTARPCTPSSTPPWGRGPRCSTSPACSPSTTPTTTAPSCATRTATTSRRSATPQCDVGLIGRPAGSQARGRRYLRPERGSFPPDPPRRRRPPVFARLGRWCYARRRLVVALWIGAVVVLGSVLGAVGTTSRSEFTLPDVESRRGTDVLKESFGGVGAGQGGTIVFAAEQGVDDPRVQAAMEDLFATTDELPGVTVRSPYSPQGQQQISARGDSAGTVAYAEVDLPADASVEDGQDVATQIEDRVPEVDGLRVLLGGQAFAEFEAPSSELLGLAFAIVILIFAFGSVLAMGLPVSVALAGIGAGSILVGLLSNVVTMPDFATTLGVMIGLGVGIDYALFIVTRFRENLHAGHDVARSTEIAIDTAGRAVLFAGTTVVISLLGMLVMGISFVTGLAVGAAVVVALTMVASLTLLPAILGFAGERIEVTRWRGLLAAGLVAVALVGLGLKISPLLVGLPLAVVVLVASLE